MNATRAATTIVDPDESDDLGALATAHARRAFHFALQLVGNRDDAMDITQEAFLRLHRHWGRRDPEKPAPAWLYAIVRNLAIDLLRRRATQARGRAQIEPPQAAPGPEVLAGRNEVRMAVWDAIRRLPPLLREVALLRDLHGLSYAEIAEALGVPVSTVNNRLHDAREQLRRELREYL